MKKLKRRLSRAFLRGSSTILHINDSPGTVKQASNSDLSSLNGGLSLIFARSCDGSDGRGGCGNGKGALCCEVYHHAVYDGEEEDYASTRLYHHPMMEQQSRHSCYGRLTRPHSTMTLPVQHAPSLVLDTMGAGNRLSMAEYGTCGSERHDDMVSHPLHTDYPLPVVMRSKTRQYESKRERDERKKRVNSWHTSRLFGLAGQLMCRGRAECEWGWGCEVS